MKLLLAGFLFLLAYLLFQSAQVAYASEPPMVFCLSPEVHDSSGNLVSSVTQGQQVLIRTSIGNTFNQSVKYLAIFEARDENNVTQFLEFQSDSIDGNRKSQVEIPWIPTEVGNYQLRTFLIQSFDNPKILTPICAGSVTII